MTIYEYCIAQVDARERAEERGETPKPEQPNGISIAGDLGGRAYSQRDARRKWARAA